MRRIKEILTDHGVSGVPDLETALINWARSTEREHIAAKRATRRALAVVEEILPKTQALALIKQRLFERDDGEA